MSKKRRVISKKKWKEKRIAQYPKPQFAVGNLVQVNHGVMDANWDDLPLGGWTGEITNIHREADGPKYDVRWNEETLEKANPVYQALAELDDLQCEEYEKIAENDLHLFAGGPVVLVEPEDVTKYTDRPLDPTDDNDRIRMIFDTKPLDHFPMLEEGDEHKEHNGKLLRRYYDHLRANLSFPFLAMYVIRHGKKITQHSFSVKALLDPDTVEEFDDLYCTGTSPHGGAIKAPLSKVFCEAEPQKPFLDDYQTWFGIIPLWMQLEFNSLMNRLNDLAESETSQNLEDEED